MGSILFDYVRNQTGLGHSHVSIIVSGQVKLSECLSILITKKGSEIKMGEIIISNGDVVNAGTSDGTIITNKPTVICG